MGTSSFNLFILHYRCQLKRYVAEKAGTPKELQDTSIKDQRDVLHDKIQGWEQMRAIYIPGLLQLLSEQGINPYAAWEADPNPEDVKLWLPSDLKKER